MNIEAIVTCVDYADFLAFTLPTNRAMFDRLVVATTPEDLATRRLCEFWNITCVPTSAFTARGQFCKGAGINAGLSELSCDGWILHLDADIVLPPLFRDLVSRANLDPAFLYGADRMMVRSYDDWMRFLAAPTLQQEDDIYVHLSVTGGFPLGVRIATSAHDGYMPIGFFQLWNAACSGIATYPESHTDATRGDMQFAAQWPRARRGFIPEAIVYHLESTEASMGANWGGRTTPPFGPRQPPALATPVAPAATVTAPASGTLSNAALAAPEIPNQLPYPDREELAPARGRGAIDNLFFLGAVAAIAYLSLI